MTTLAIVSAAVIAIVTLAKSILEFTSAWLRYKAERQRPTEITLNPNSTPIQTHAPRRVETNAWRRWRMFMAVTNFALFVGLFAVLLYIGRRGPVTPVTVREAAFFALMTAAIVIASRPERA